MAQTFLNLFKEVKETVYSDAALSVVVIAGANSSVEFTPNLAPNGSTTTSKYTVNRRKRPSVNTVANANLGSTAAALAALDQFSTIDWDSQEITTGTLKSVGFKQKFNDDYDFSTNPMHAQDMKYIVGEQGLDRKARLIALMEKFTPTTAVIPTYTAGDTKLWDYIADEIITLGQVDDEYKSKQGATDFVVVISADLAKNLTKENGVAFNQEAPIAKTGFTSGTSVNGTAVIVDQTLAPKTFYAYHSEALAFQAKDIDKDVSIDLGLTEFTGRFFYDVLAIIDTARAVKGKKTV